MKRFGGLNRTATFIHLWRGARHLTMTWSCCLGDCSAFGKILDLIQSYGSRQFTENHPQKRSIATEQNMFCYFFVNIFLVQFRISTPLVPQCAKPSREEAGWLLTAASIGLQYSALSSIVHQGWETVSHCPHVLLFTGIHLLIIKGPGVRRVWSMEMISFPFRVSDGRLLTSSSKE